MQKNKTYYVGKPIKEGNNYKQKVVYIDFNLKSHINTSYSPKASDFTGGFMGYNVSERAIRISESKFEKLSKFNNKTTI